MEKRSDSESVEILGDWDLTPPEERIVMVSVPTSPESDYARSNQPKEIESRVSDKESASASGEVAARRVLPPWMDPSYEWGGGKWKVDGRKNKNKNKKEKEKEEIIPFKEIIEALLGNSGDKVQQDNKVNQSQSSVEMLKSMGFKFP